MTASKSKTPPASIRSTLKLLETVRDSIPDHSSRTCIVAFSGGKDSWAVLNLAHQVFGQGNIHAYNLYLVPSLECELREIRRAERRYSLTIHRFPHPGIAHAIRAGHLQPVETDFRRKLSHADIYRLVRHITQSDWIVFGHRMDESLQRRGMISAGCGGVAKYLETGRHAVKVIEKQPVAQGDPEDPDVVESSSLKIPGLIPGHRKCYPLWNWKKHDVYHYLRAVKITAPEQYTEDDTTGFTLAPNTLLYIKEKYPDDYRKVIDLFPLAEAQFYRERQRLKAGLKFTINSINQRQDLQDSFNGYFDGKNENGKQEAEREAKRQGERET